MSKTPVRCRRGLAPIGAAAFVLSLAPLAGAETLTTAALDRRLADVEQLAQALTAEMPPLPPLPLTMPVQLPQDYAAQVEVRLAQVERQLQMLTGALEQLQHQNAQLNERLERALSDVEFRIGALEGGAPAGTAAAAGPTWTPPQREQQAAAAPSAGQTLGTLIVRPDEPAAGQAQPTVVSPQGAALPTGDVANAYNYAYSLLQQGNYPAAEQALRQFIQAYPTDPLASNALYWLGETFYVRGQYNDAAVAFAQAYQQYPAGAKAVDSLLKLGMSLGAVGQRADACLTFNQLQVNFPTAPSAIRRRAEQERERLQCG